MRCVNLDWLEVSCEESVGRYPCNADYFRSKGYWVKEREYGTRVWGEVFTIDDTEGKPWIEIRREPPSGKSEFKGLTQFSCRLRLVNAQCYVKGCVQRLRDFMIQNDYIFKRIFRIDVCYDFERFDSGDYPARFARRILERRFRKVNQCKIHAIGDDRWTAFDWETLSWGHPTSMVSTKFYNKSRELATVSKEKVYIKYAWFESGLVDNPITFTKRNSLGQDYTPEIWRVEFSLRSKADRWLVIESQGGKKVKKKAIPHNLQMFDNADKLWQRFEDLAYHYFRFKIARFKKPVEGIISIAMERVSAHDDAQEYRKDLCPEKKLFKFNQDRNFCQLDMAIRAEKPSNELETLRRRLVNYRASHADQRLRDAAQCLIEALDQEDMRRYTPKQLFSETEALRRALALRMKYPEVDVHEAFEEIRELLFNEEIF